MRKFPRFENNDCPDDLIHALDACDDQIRELIGMSRSRLKLLRSGKVATTRREFQLLQIIQGNALPPSWGKFTSLRVRNDRLYLSKHMIWKDGITEAELRLNGMTRAELRMIAGQADLIEQLTKERNFYKKQCGYEARYGLMLWQCFGE